MSKNKIEIVSYTDPYCTWCWGSEPIVRKIEQIFGEQVEFNYVMGGLVRDIKVFQDPANGIGGDKYYEQVAEHWYDASLRHGMPVNELIFIDTKDEFTSTWPSNIAFKAAELQDKGIAIKYLRRMREAVSAERRRINRVEVQAELIKEVGLDEKKFYESIENKEAVKAFQKDLEEAYNKGVSGFPTFIVRNANGDEVMLRGYNPYKRFEKVIKQLAEGIELKEMAISEESLLDLFRKYENITKREIEEIFSITEAEANKWIDDLKKKGYISDKKVGNGYFYRMNTNPLLCDPDTGMCG